MKPRILYYDIETSPNLGYVWSLWNQNVGLSQLKEQGDIISIAWKWEEDKEIHSMDVWHDGLNAIVKRAHALLDEADWVVTFNGRKFDNKRMHAAMIERGFTPPSPYQNIDLYQVCKDNFSWPSMKMEYVLKRLGLAEQKIKTIGFELWFKCMEGDWDAIRDMVKYNKQDVRVMPALYERLRPWVPGHPNYAHYVDTDQPACPHCGSHRLQSRGVTRLQVHEYRRYHCRDCGAWPRGAKRKATDKKVLRTQRISR